MIKIGPYTLYQVTNTRFFFSKHIPDWGSPVLELSDKYEIVERGNRIPVVKRKVKQ